MIARIFYKLECGHTMKAPATFVNGTLYCLRCLDYWSIVDIITLEWRAKCMTCRFARWAGMDKRTAEIFANGHASRNIRHVVTVGQWDNPDAITTRGKWDAWQAKRRTA